MCAAITANPDRKPKKGYWGILIATLVALIGIPGGIWIALAPTSSEMVTPEPSLTPVSPTAPESPPLPRDFVAEGMPESFVIECGSETLIATQSLTTTIRSLREIIGNTKHYDLVVPGDTIALVKDEGVPWASLPGSDAGTVSIWGHADSNPRMAFNPIADFIGDPGECRAIIVVPGGVLMYGFVQSHIVTPKSEQFNVSKELSTLPDKVGKLLVSTCSDADSEVIWEFRLISSQAT